MTGNVNFENPIPDIATLLTSRNNYSSGFIAAGSGSHTAVAEKNAFRLALETDLTTMG